MEVYISHLFSLPIIVPDFAAVIVWYAFVLSVVDEEIHSVP